MPTGNNRSPSRAGGHPAHSLGVVLDFQAGPVSPRHTSHQLVPLTLDEEVSQKACGECFQWVLGTVIPPGPSDGKGLPHLSQYITKGLDHFHVSTRECTEDARAQG